MNTLVLVSGGLDSMVLLASEALHGPVQPVYLRSGLAWEAAEQRALQTLLGADPFRARVAPLVTLTLDVRAVYPAAHWATAGAPPAYDAPEPAVYLPGRNLMLLSTAAVYASCHGLEKIVLATLAGNPFADASPAFFHALEGVCGMALAQRLVIAAPFADRSKAEVLLLGERLGVPVQQTLSCLAPVAGRQIGHCGRCSKCRERCAAFAAAGLVDPTRYEAVAT